MTEARTMTDAAEAIRQFREALLDAGYLHANGAGELVSSDGTTWVATTYVHGEYTIHYWRRPRGHSELGEKRERMAVYPHTDPQRVEALAAQLVRWAKRPGRKTWPPRPPQLRTRV